MSLSTYETGTVRVQATLDSCHVDFKEAGKPYAYCNFRENLPGKAYRLHRKFYNLYGNALQYSLRDLKELGLKGNVAAMYNQGIHNGSKVLAFGETFEIELGTFNSKPSVGSVRKVGENQLRSSASVNDVQSVLNGISTSLIEE